MEIEPRTHDRIDARLVGAPVRLSEGAAEVALTTQPEMATDERGLVHGGFLFGLADYAAMLAINHPHVVLAAASVRFLRPVVVGDALVAHARVRGESEATGKKAEVEVDVKRGDTVVLAGTFTCVTPGGHVLDRI